MNEEEYIKNKILELFNKESNKPMSIREITIKLEEDYSIKKSPQVILRYIEDLVKEKKIAEE